MRTDGVQMSAEAVEELRAANRAAFGPGAVPPQPRWVTAERQGERTGSRQGQMGRCEAGGREAGRCVECNAGGRAAGLTWYKGERA